MLGKTSLVIGGTGSIGSAIVRALVKSKDTNVIVFSRDEYKQYKLKQELGDRVGFIIGDIRSQDALTDALQGVDWCFHTAAMKHVPICEENPFEAVKTNILGTQNLIKAAVANKVAKVLAISTDKAVNPTSVLGCTKLLMERILGGVNTPHTRFASIRFGNIANSRGSVLPLWKEQVEKGGPVTVTDSRATRYFLTIEEAVDSAISAIQIMAGGEVFVVSQDKPSNIYDLAAGIAGNTPIKMTGLRPGEKLHEELFTQEERIRARACKVDGLMVI